MYKKALPFVLVLSLLNLAAWVIQVRLLQNHSAIYSVFFKLLTAFITFIACLHSLKKKYTLTFASALMICLIILIPGALLSSAVVHLVMFGHYTPDLSSNLFLTLYAVPLIAAVVSPFFFLGINSAKDKHQCRSTRRCDPLKSYFIFDSHAFAAASSLKF